MALRIEVRSEDLTTTRFALSPLWELLHALRNRLNRQHINLPQLCRERGIIYQGFSLLTANVDVVHHPTIAALAERMSATPPQIIFAFARAIGILPLTGTSSAEHMKQDLASSGISLAPDELRAIEALG